MRIKIENATRWNTTDLRRLYKAALRQAGAKPNVRAHLTVKYKGGSSFSVGGNCYYGVHSRPGACTLFIPRRVYSSFREAGRSLKGAVIEVPTDILIVPDLRDRVARVMHHEALHGVGARHKDMTEDQLYAKQPVPWAADLPLRVKEEKPVDRAAAFEDKLAHSRGMLARAETRAKRAATILKKWRRRVAALERRTP